MARSSISTQLTAAHRTLPMPSIVRVTNLENGRSIKLRVNDRGPYARGRIIDVSRRAAQLLGFEGQGTAKVRVQIMVPESIQVASLAGRRGRRAGACCCIAATASRAGAAVAAQPLPPPPGVSVAANKPVPLAAGAEAAATESPASIAERRLPETVQVVPVQPTSIYIQAGAFASIDRATHSRPRLQKFGPVNVTSARVNGMNIYRVRLGPLSVCRPGRCAARPGHHRLARGANRRQLILMNSISALRVRFRAMLIHRLLFRCTA